MDSAGSPNRDCGGFATYLAMWDGLLYRQSPHSDNGKSERTARRIAGSLNGCHAGPHFSGNGGPILGRAKATAGVARSTRPSTENQDGMPAVPLGEETDDTDQRKVSATPPAAARDLGGNASVEVKYVVCLAPYLLT